MRDLDQLNGSPEWDSRGSAAAWIRVGRNPNGPRGFASGCRGIVLVLLGFGLGLESSGAQIALPAPAPPAVEAPKEAEGVLAAPTGVNAEATAAEPSGPIAVHTTISDDQLRKKLEDLLPRYPGVRSIDVDVDNGIVTLTGHVENNEIRDRLRDFVRRVEGVNLVLNQTLTDAQVLNAWELARLRLMIIASLVSRKWLLGVLAIVTIVLSIALARLFWRFSDTILSLVIGNPLLRSVLGSVIGSVIIGGGILSALSVLGLTETVLPGLGLAGVVALAVSFAFRDIAENFIASILLGARRPFRTGDYIEIAGWAGVVVSLNTRATVLMTLEGFQVRIPNARVFKEVVTNKSASSSTRGTFDVVIPYEASTALAVKAMTNTLRTQDLILDEPPPRVLVEALEAGGVRLRSYFWMPTKNVDGFQLMSDLKLRCKVALQEAGISPAPPQLAVTVADRVPLLIRREQDEAGRLPGLRPGSAVDPDRIRANAKRDRRAAEGAESQPATNVSESEREHVLNAVRDSVDAEGQNLLEGH